MSFNAFGRRAFIASVGASIVGMSARRAAAELSLPTEKPILTIKGKISAATAGEGVEFDRPMLEKLGVVSFETATPWFTGTSKFEGVPMTKLLSEVGSSGERLVVVALNDYQSEIPIEDFERYGVILALKRNGEYMPISDKGPLFIIYPFDSNPALKSQKFYSRSVWQVRRLEVR